MVGQMHMQGITMRELATEMGITNRYLSAIINGHKTPANAEQRCSEAFLRILKRRETSELLPKQGE